jgi:Holliday junction resolvase RusA-like endonuclease
LWDVLTDTGFFKDDSQIVIFEARKGYGEEDKIKIEIDEINEEEI